MGNFFSYPLEAEAASYHRRQDYNSLGIRKADVVKEENEIDRLHRTYCAEIFGERKLASEKSLLLTVDNKTYSKRFPQWRLDDISDLKIQFTIFDPNCDGLIDYRELNIVLDMYGEDSTPEERYKCFQEFDLDDSGTIDFEEFLTMVTLLSKAKKMNTTAENINTIVRRGAEHSKQIRKMSVREQMINGLF